ncbi:MAG: RidA family protein [Planctomycetota bacterium]
MESKTRVRSGSPYEERFGFCRAMRIGDRVLVAGTAPIGPDGSCPETAAEQALLCWEIIQNALEEVGASCDDVVRTRMLLVDAADADAVGEVHGEFFRTAMPVSTMVVIGGLLDPRWRIEVEAEAFAPAP